VSEFKYLENIIENNNRNDRCRTERIQTGNKAHYANFQMLKSKIISRRSKLQIYKTLIRPVTYGAETWTLRSAEENALRRFEKKVLRKIYGPVVDKGVWRIRYNDELCKLMAGKVIVRFIKAQRIQWLGHVERMDETAMPKRVLKGKLYATRRIGRPKIRWLEDVIADLRRMGISGWMEKARNRDQWRWIVEEAKVHPGL
jgi:hypothetical protein